MAIVQNPITGRSSGTYAGAVFATQFGKNVLRSKPVSVSVSQSDASKLARQKFKALAEALKELIPALNLFFTSKEFGMPVFSYMLKQAYHRAVSGTLNNVVVDYSKLIVAQDSLNLSSGITFSAFLDETEIGISVPYVNNAIGSDNKLNVVLYNETKGKIIGIGSSTSSNDEYIVISYPMLAEGDIIRAFVKPVTKVTSNAASELAVFVSDPILPE